MLIEYNQGLKIFRLNTEKSCYIIKIRDNLEPEHLYWGENPGSLNYHHLVNPNSFAALLFPHPDLGNPYYSHSAVLREYPALGNSDYRIPAFSVLNSEGDSLADLKYREHRIVKGKERVSGLPSVSSSPDTPCETLEITLSDALIGLETVLFYTVFPDFDIIVRSARFLNKGNKKLLINKAASMAVDFDRGDFDIIHLPGALFRERDVEREGLGRGVKGLGSRKGSSGHGSNPFLVLCDRETTENEGPAYGISLIYSGDFEISAETDELFRTRVVAGINPENFSWLLEPGECFQTPEAVLSFSCAGLNGLSGRLHRFYTAHLFKTREEADRPVLFNSWEAALFDYDEALLREFADSAAELGAEVFVVDDGWFGERDDDTRSLGDWRVNTAKFPGGLAPFIDYLKTKGMGFGLWVEPEMVCPDSDLFKARPEWCLGVSGRPCSLGRNQLVLDLVNPEVREFILSFLSELLSRYDIAYIKWDMNRYHTEAYSSFLLPERRGETSHRFMLGLYEIMEEITNRFPHVLFEGCASGGGRFDPGILHYMPQVWTSDNTDPIARLKIQYGTSYAYPPAAMGCHITGKKSFFGGRETSYKTKFHVAMMGNLGLELDPRQLDPGERELFKKYIALYKEYRRDIHSGAFFRLKNPAEGAAAWITVSEDKTRALVMYCSILGDMRNPDRRLRLRGLDRNIRYSIENAGEIYAGRNDNGSFPPGLPLPPEEASWDTVVSGGQLLSSGLLIPDSLLREDFFSLLWVLRGVKDI